MPLPANNKLCRSKLVCNGEQIGEVIYIEIQFTGSEITTLAHEVGDDSVEGGSLEVKRLSRFTNPLFSSAESAEVLGSLGGNISTELHMNREG